MHSKLALLLLVTFASCESEKVNDAVTTDNVFESLQSAYALEGSGNVLGADSVYRSLLASSNNAADSARVSRSYVSILITKGDFDEALFHIDKAFPATSVVPEDLLRRYSYRLRVYMQKRQCDSIRVELDHLFNLVGSNGPLQLSMEDLVHNRAVVDSLCGALKPAPIVTSP